MQKSMRQTEKFIKGDFGIHRRCIAIEGWVYIRASKTKSSDVLLRIPYTTITIFDIEKYP